ncbi:hypothetical protein CPB97_004103, partial [Podila verticillata]
ETSEESTLKFFKSPWGCHQLEDLELDGFLPWTVAETSCQKSVHLLSRLKKSIVSPHTVTTPGKSLVDKQVLEALSVHWSAVFGQEPPAIIKAFEWLVKSGWGVDYQKSRADALTRLWIILLNDQEGRFSNGKNNDSSGSVRVCALPCL